MAEKLTTEKKAELIAKVRENLTPDLQPLFNEYSSGRNPQLPKRLLDNTTDWKEVLTKWDESKKKKPSKGRKVTNPKTLLDKIESEIKTNSFDSLKTAIVYCQDLIKVLEQKKDEQKQAKIAENDAKIAELKKQNEELKGEQAEQAGE